MNSAMRKRAVVVLIVGTVAAGAWGFRNRSAAAREGRLTANGTVEATEVEIGAQRSARLTAFRVEEGASVRKGEVIAVLDTSELQAQLDQSRAAAERATAKLAELRRGTRSEEVARAAGQLDQARANVEGTKGALDTARLGYSRRTPLRQGLDTARTQVRTAEAAVAQSEASREGAAEALKIAQQDFETSLQLRTARDTARQQVETAEAAVRSARAKLEELENGTRPEELRAAEAQVQQAVAAVEQARAELENAQVDAGRARQLFADRAIAKQMVDTAETRERTAAARARQAQQAREQAEARLQELRNGARQEQVTAARATVQQAEATLTGNRSNLRNAEQSLELRLGAAAALEAARTRKETAESQVNSARSALQGARLTEQHSRTTLQDALSERLQVVGAEQQFGGAQGLLRAAEAQLAELKHGATPEEVAQVEAELKQARASLRLAQVQVEQSVIRAPGDGVLTEHVAEPGEVVGPGATVARLVQLDQVYLTLFVPLPELGKVKIGQEVEVTADTFVGKRYRGKVARISDTPEFTPRNVQTRDERVKLVFQVRVEVSNPDRELKPGMPADARILSAGAAR